MFTNDPPRSPKTSGDLRKTLSVVTDHVDLLDGGA